MLKEKRISQIRALLERDAQVEISNLCRMFGVTDMTIRRDLDNLCQDGGFIRTHGGAMVVDVNSFSELPIDHRRIVNSAAKERIGKKALEFIEPAQKIILDSGTTTGYLAMHMPNSMKNVVITNSINIAQETITRPHISTMLIGGELYRNTLSCRGALTDEQISRFRADIAFVSTNNIGADGYCYVGASNETGFKQAAMAASQKTILLADSTKFESVNLIYYAHISQMDVVITDAGLPDKVHEAMLQMGAKIVIA